MINELLQTVDSDTWERVRRSRSDRGAVKALNDFFKSQNEGRHPLVIWLNQHCPNVQKMDNPITDDEAKRILSEFTRPNIMEVFEAMDNRKDKSKYIYDMHTSANRTFRNWIKSRPNGGRPPKQHIATT